MATLSPSSVRFPALDVGDATSPARAADTHPIRRWHGALSAFVAIAGAAMSVAGGGWKAGAFNLYPREDGLFTSGVFVALAAFAHGLRERTALLVASPIVALTAYGIWRGHHRPLALVGAELAIIGALGVAFERWRAREGAR